MSLQKQAKLPLLAITFCGLLLILGKSLLDSNIGKPTPFSFPAEVPLPEWQQQGSRPLSDKKPEQTEVLTGRQYSYIANNRALDIEIRYLLNTDGDVQRLIGVYTSIKPTANNSKLPLARAEGVGFYTLFNHQGRAYLSACINPRGGTTVTHQQYADNRDKYDFQFGRLLPWLIGQEQLRDERCLWALLSTPSDGKAPEPAYQILEKAWLSWYKWWQPKFPKY